MATAAAQGEQLSDLLEEKCLSATAAARLLGVNVSTVIRWIVRGVRGVRLKAVRVGVQWRTSREALDRFSFELTSQNIKPEPDSDPSGDRQVNPAANRPADRGRDDDQSQRELAARYGM
jgi:excisionase family DNA binding protein